MKTAIIHDVFIEFGGAERVLLNFLKIYPDADIYIPLLRNKWIMLLQQYTHGKIVSSFFNHIPFIHSASILLKPFLYLYWEQLDLSKYDLVISSSHSFSSKSVITSPDALHISYIHTPPKYLYTEYNEARALNHPFLKVILSPLMSWLRIRDFTGAQRPDILIANSKTVQARIKKYYRRDSIIIYPPVNIPHAVQYGKKRYYLCVSRLARQKGTELAIRACNELGLPLWVVGTGTQEKYLKSIAGPTIKFKGWIKDEEMGNIYAHGKALLYSSMDEDFGMVPVEAMAHGVSVIAYRSGAIPEIVVHNRTGILFDEYSVDAVKKAITRFEKSNISASTCIKRAQFFSEAKFFQRFHALLKTKFKI